VGVPIGLPDLPFVACRQQVVFGKEGAASWTAQQFHEQWITPEVILTI
jgi:hypothetical protein